MNKTRNTPDEMIYLALNYATPGRPEMVGITTLKHGYEKRFWTFLSKPFVITVFLYGHCHHFGSLLFRPTWNSFLFYFILLGPSGEDLSTGEKVENNKNQFDINLATVDGAT